MILKWKNSDHFIEQKVMGVIYDAGIIERKDLNFVLEMNTTKVQRAIRKLTHEEEPRIVAYGMCRGRKAYYLTAKGMKEAQRMVSEFETKISTVEGQESHTLGLNSVLFRYLRTHGKDKVEWYSTREASDNLSLLRSVTTGQQEDNLKATTIRPDALLTIEDKNWWIEFDNNTEDSKKLMRKYRMYIRNLRPLDSFYKNVVWVTKNEDRKEIMETLWEAVDDDSISMKFYVEGNEEFS